MIRAFYGLERNPFSHEGYTLLRQQQEVYETLRVHSQQGGLCLVLGVPGTGKTMIRDEILRQADEKRMLVVTVARTLHTYTNTLHILCGAFHIDTIGRDATCEKLLIEEAFKLNHTHKTIVPIIDDAHLMQIDCLRKLRLLFEDFPKNHNLILIGQPSLLTNINLSVNEDIKSRVTYSVVVAKLNPDDISGFILDQLDRVKLGHNTFTEAALDLIVRSSEGVIRRARNLALSSMLEAVRDRTKKIDLKQVNRVLIQPHWRQNHDMD